jgi:hypothetical protein
MEYRFFRFSVCFIKRAVLPHRNIFKPPAGGQADQAVLYAVAFCAIFNMAPTALIRIDIFSYQRRPSASVRKKKSIGKCRTLVPFLYDEEEVYFYYN